MPKYVYSNSVNKWNYPYFLGGGGGFFSRDIAILIGDENVTMLAGTSWESARSTSTTSPWPTASTSGTTQSNLMQKL